LDPDSIGSVDPDPEKRERGTEGGWVGLGGREWGGGDENEKHLKQTYVWK